MNSQHTVNGNIDVVAKLIIGFQSNSIHFSLSIDFDAFSF